MMQYENARKAIVSVAVLIGIVGTWLVFTQTGQQIATAQDAFDTASSHYTQDETLVAQIPQLSARRLRLWNTMHNFQTGKKSVSAFMSYLDVVARGHRIRIEHVAFTAQNGLLPHPAPAATASAVVAAPISSTQGSVNEQPCTLVLEGAYKPLLFALADLSRGPILLRISERPAIEAGVDTLTMTVTATLLEVNLPTDATEQGGSYERTDS
jgi:hypothetical protein